MDGANTAWILTSTALVLFMTLPGLALFYGGLVRSSNVLSVLMHCFAIACLASILWLAIGYSLAFADGSAWVGSFQKAFFAGVGKEALSGDIPESVFFMFQMTFAIINAGAHRRRVSRAHQIRCRTAVQRPLARYRLRPGNALDLGWWLAR